MCGIAGILGRLTDGNRAARRAMSNCMSHRGPNAEGFWESAGDAEGFGCLLAHRRLSILDLSTGANPRIIATGQTEDVAHDPDHHRASWDRAGWDLTLVLCGAGLVAVTGLYAAFGAIP